MQPGLSPLALYVDNPRDVADRAVAAYGVGLHTTGGGVPEKAAKAGISPLEYAIGYYTNPKNYFAHYVVDTDGTRVQIANEREAAQHIGRFPNYPNKNPDRREQYMDGSWVKLAPPVVVQAWLDQWGHKYKHPYQLFPGPYPNQAYVGIEMIPIWPTPPKGRLRFTPVQHQSVAELCADIGKRNKFPHDWWNMSRLAGHEDISPLDRFDKGGMWDPGFGRPDFYFDFPLVRGLTAEYTRRPPAPINA